MRVLNILTSGEAGGIESLCRDIGINAQYHNSFCFLFKGGAVYEQMKSAGLDVHCLENIGGKLSVRKFRALKDVAKEYDIIAVHNGHALAKYYHYLLSKKLKKKYVTFVHSCYEDRFMSHNFLKRYLQKLFFQKGLDISDLIVFVSNAGKESYGRVFKFQESKTKVIYNGIGLDKIEAGQNAKANRETPYNLLFVGRLIEAKGVELLLRAVERLRSEFPITVSIVGDGPDRQRLETITNSLNLETIVTFYGRQLDVIPFYKKASIFIYVSTWQEVFGISIVEGMSFGRPCIVNRVGGIPEIVEDGISGYITESPTSEGVVRAISRAIMDIENGNIEKISLQAKARAKFFSIDRTIAELQEAFLVLTREKD